MDAGTWDFTIHDGQYRVRVVPNDIDRGYRAKLISVGIGTIMEPAGNTPTEALMALVQDLYADFSTGDRKLAKEIAKRAALPIVWADLGTEPTRAHATKRSHAAKAGAAAAGKLTWTRRPGTIRGGRAISAPISYGDTHHYVISHRPDEHTVSYRPPGQHHHVGTYKTAREAKAAAEQHAKTGEAPPSTDKWSVAAWGS